MISFSNDADILKYEPVLFGELHLPGQILAMGASGVLSGFVFSASGADFVSAQVREGGVIYLESADGSLDGAFEIVSVDSATQLSVSVIRADSDDDAIAPPGANDISYRISTFEPQSREVAFRLSEYFGISPDNSGSDPGVDDIMDVSVLKSVSAYAVISSVYTMLASSGDNENFWKKSRYYRELFESARNRCRVCIDSGGDGVSDITITGGAIRLTRD